MFLKNQFLKGHEGAAKHSAHGSDGASRAPNYQHCPITSRMASWPTSWGSAQLLCTTVAATADSGSRCPACWRATDVIDVHTTCDEGALIPRLSIRKRRDFCPASFSPVQTRGGETPLTKLHEARGIFSIIKPSLMPPSLLPTVCVYYEGGCAVLWSQR